MKKFSIVVIVLLIFIFPIFQIKSVKAEDNTFKVITECSLYESPKLNYDEGTGIITTLNFGEILQVNGQEEGEDCDFLFYSVSLEKNGENLNGYVISYFVVESNITSLARILDPNAKILKTTNVFNSPDVANKMILGENEVVLQQLQDIKIIDGYDKSKVFHKIMFEQDGAIYTGYIKTSDLFVEGVNPSFILAIFIFLIAVSIAFSILYSTIKKRKKLKKNENLK